MERKPDWLMRYESICWYCDPDEPTAAHYGEMHEDCFEDYIWLIQFRLDYALHYGILDQLLMGRDFPS